MAEPVETDMRPANGAAVHPQSGVRRKCQFSLRSLLLLMTGCAIVCALTAADLLDTLAVTMVPLYFLALLAFVTAIALNVRWPFGQPIRNWKFVIAVAGILVLVWLTPLDWLSRWWLSFGDDALIQWLPLGFTSWFVCRGVYGSRPKADRDAMRATEARWSLLWGGLATIFVVYICSWHLAIDEVAYYRAVDQWTIIWAVAVLLVIAAPWSVLARGGGHGRWNKGWAWIGGTCLYTSLACELLALILIGLTKVIAPRPPPPGSGWSGLGLVIGAMLVLIYGHIVASTLFGIALLVQFARGRWHVVPTMLGAAYWLGVCLWFAT